MARVLIVEPEPDLRSLAEQALLELGHEPVLFEDDTPSEPIDAVILATFDGMTTVTDELRRRRHDLPIICVGMRPAGGGAGTVPPVAHLMHPYTLAQLQNALQGALDHREGT
jgi:CheY-like chemotaxis protein